MSAGDENPGEPQRDGKGRWKKGSSGNAKGARPKKRRLDVPSQIGRDVLEVNRQKVIVQGPDGPRTITKGELCIEAIYANVIKGKVSAQKLWLELSRAGLKELIERHPSVELAEVFRLIYEDPMREPKPAEIEAVDTWRRRIKRL